MDWVNDCGGDKCLDGIGIITTFANVWPDGSYSVSISINRDCGTLGESRKELIRHEDYTKDKRSQPAAMVLVEKWLRDKIAKIELAVTGCLKND